MRLAQYDDASLIGRRVVVMVMTGVGILIWGPATLLERGHGVTAVRFGVLEYIHIVGRFSYPGQRLFREPWVEA